jgi:hypothetical protein
MREPNRAATMAHCLAYGNGTWVRAPLIEPYLLETHRYMPHYNKSAMWWGSCDDDVRASLWAGEQRRPPRPELGYAFRRRGPGCKALRQNTITELVPQFCRRWRNKTILFVGDSHSAEMFTSFVHSVGFLSSMYNTSDICWKRKTSYGIKAGRGAQEIDQVVRLCEAAPHGPLAVFKRNEALLVDPQENIRRRSPGRPAILCDWHQEIPKADFILLNRGMWRSSDWLLLRELNATFRYLKRTLAGTELSQRVLFRSTWGSLEKCRTLTDPLTREQADAALHRQVAAQRDKYEWGKIAHQNVLAHGMAKAFAVPFWDVYPATLMRPAGHRRQDCGHFCLPGPPDELTREFLAYLTEL